MGACRPAVVDAVVAAAVVGSDMLAAAAASSVVAAADSCHGTFAVVAASSCCRGGVGLAAAFQDVAACPDGASSLVAAAAVGLPGRLERASAFSAAETDARRKHHTCQDAFLRDRPFGAVANVDPSSHRGDGAFHQVLPSRAWLRQEEDPFVAAAACYHVHHLHYCCPAVQRDPSLMGQRDCSGSIAGGLVESDREQMGSEVP